jgi:hypothetical protein
LKYYTKGPKIGGKVAKLDFKLTVVEVCGPFKRFSNQGHTFKFPLTVGRAPPSESPSPEEFSKEGIPPE